MITTSMNDVNPLPMVPAPPMRTGAGEHANLKRDVMDNPSGWLDLVQPLIVPVEGAVFVHGLLDALDILLGLPDGRNLIPRFHNFGGPRVVRGK